MVVKGATMATRYSGKLAKGFGWSEYTVGFIIIAIISILPETFISINSAISGIPAFGLGMLFGSNIADLTLIFALLVFFAGRSLKVESKIIKSDKIYPVLLILPLLLGINGHFSRPEGAALILSGCLFYFFSLKEGKGNKLGHKDKNEIKDVLLLLFSMGLLLLGAHFTVSSATDIANMIGISPVLIGMLVVGLGTTMPEFFFALKSIKKQDDALAIGDVLGTVLADATVVVGILALISPFSFPKGIIYVSGVFMVISAFILLRFMRSGKSISRREAFMLFLFWIIFVLVEFLVNK